MNGLGAPTRLTPCPSNETFHRVGSQENLMAQNLMADVDKPLAGITVVELGHSVAAPYAGLILADLGARVIKVENPKGGDYARGWGPPFWKDTATLFHGLNDPARSRRGDPESAARNSRKIRVYRRSAARREAGTDLVRHRRLRQRRTA